LTAEERRYVLAYLRHPETVGERRDARRVAAAAVGSWDAWSPARRRGAARDGADAPRRGVVG
jgi:hypothetical protein